MEIIVALAVGYVIGMLQGGIHIIHQKDSDIPKDYNQSINKNEEIKQYYKETGGMNHF